MKEPLPYPQLLRKIACDALDKVFQGDLSDETRAELATALVRQWITRNGHAALLTEQDQFWYQVSPLPDGGANLNRNHVPGSRVYNFMRDWQFEPDQVPDIIHNLNVRQTAEITNRRGERLRMWVIPEERTFRIERLPETVDV